MAQLIAQIHQALLAKGLINVAQVMNLEARPCRARLPLLTTVGEKTCLEHRMPFDQPIDRRFQHLRCQAVAVEFLIQMTADSTQRLFAGTPHQVGVLYAGQSEGLAVSHERQRFIFIDRLDDVDLNGYAAKQLLPALQRRLVIEVSEGHFETHAAKPVEPGHQVHRVHAQFQQAGVLCQ